MGQVTLETVLGGTIPVQTISAHGAINWWRNRRLQAFRATTSGRIMTLQDANEHPALPHGMWALWIVNLKDSSFSFTVRDLPNSFSVVLGIGQAMMVNRFGSPAAWVPTVPWNVL